MTAEIGSEDRVAMVRRAWDAYNAGDIEAVLRFFDADVEVYVPTELANAGTYKGHEEFVRWVAAWNDAWESFDTRVIETVPVGERHAVSYVHQTGIGRGSGVEVTRDIGWLYEVRDGRCVHVGLHPSFDSALAVAREREGLESDVGS